MTSDELKQTADLLRWNAARFRLPAHPNAWPEWMTADKRLSMADNFEFYAAEIDRILIPGQQVGK